MARKADKEKQSELENTMKVLRTPVAGSRPNTTKERREQQRQRIAEAKARAKSPGAKKRRGGKARWIAAGIAVIVIVGILVGSGSSLPPGAWGKTIKCLEGHPTFKVYDGGSSNASAPNSKTTSVDVWSNFGGYSLVTIQKMSSPAAAQNAVSTNALLAPKANYGTDGDIVWAFTEGGNSAHVLASLDQQGIITGCIQSP